VLQVEVAKLRDDLKSRGVLERNEKTSATGRSYFRRAKLDLLASGLCIEQAS
jgi:hypothetical protein